MCERLWILGASDPEMNEIENLLRETGEVFAYALDARGERVSPVTAYKAVKTSAEAPADATVYLVECGVDGITNEVVRIDHHRPGDPGYGRPPAEFLAASSIGQVIDALARLGRLPAAWPETAWPRRLYGRPRVGLHGIKWSVTGTPLYVACVAGSATHEVYAVRRLSDDERSTRDVYTRVPAVSRICAIPKDILLAAAADHCLAAAYRGECPGVDPDALMRWRAETRATYQRRTVADVLADVERAREALRGAPSLRLAEGVPEVRDMRGYGLYRRTTVLVVPYVEGATCDASGVGDGSTLIVASNLPTGAWDEGSHHTFVECVSDDVPELPEAAVRDGIAYLATVTDRDGRKKIVLGGHTSPEIVKAFLERLVDLYGDPARGFAGGYLPAGARATVPW